MKRIIDVKLELLAGLQAWRKQNPLSAHNGNSLCRLMHDQVNRMRSDMDVTFEQIEKAEDKALGRVDYEAKFALYCAELVLQ